MLLTGQETIQEVYSCQTYNVANHVLVDYTTHYTAAAFEAIYNMSKRTKDKRLLHLDAEGLSIHIGQRKLAEVLRCSERTIRRAINQLKVLGILAVKCIRKHASNRNFYRIIFPEKPIPGDLITEPVTDPTHADILSGCIQVSIINTVEEKNFISPDVACPHGTSTTHAPVVDDTPPVAKTDRWLDHMPWLRKPQPQPKTKDIPIDINIPIAEPIAPSTEQSTEGSTTNTTRGRVGSLGSFISEITKNLGVADNPALTNPVYAKKSEIDRSTMNGAIKKIHKGILDHLGLRGIVFIDTYLHTNRIVLEFNVMIQHYQAVIEDPLVKTVICMQYGEMFRTLNVKII